MVTKLLMLQILFNKVHTLTFYDLIVSTVPISEKGNAEHNLSDSG